MELLIAVLVSLGVVTSTDAVNLDSSSAEKLIEQNNISKAELEKEASIIGLEESDF